MDIRIIETETHKIAVLDSDTPVITDGQSALDLAASIGYEHNCYKLAVYKAAVVEDFFKLSTGIAGEVVQKFVNYGFRLAIIGDFSGYSSKPLRDFINESNKGKHLCFVADEAEAIRKLGN